jgi:hypothetical protein
MGFQALPFARRRLPLRVACQSAKCGETKGLREVYENRTCSEIGQRCSVSRQEWSKTGQNDRWTHALCASSGYIRPTLTHVHVMDHWPLVDYAHTYVRTTVCSTTGHVVLRTPALGGKPTPTLKTLPPTPLPLVVVYVRVRLPPRDGTMRRPWRYRTSETDPFPSSASPNALWPLPPHASASPPGLRPFAFTCPWSCSAFGSFWDSYSAGDSVESRSSKSS